MYKKMLTFKNNKSRIVDEVRKGVEDMLSLPVGEIVFVYDKNNYECMECIDLNCYEDFIEEIDYLLSLYKKKPKKIIYLEHKKKIFEEII